jgi:hypothetical protein
MPLCLQVEYNQFFRISCRTPPLLDCFPNPTIRFSLPWSFGTNNKVYDDANTVLGYCVPYGPNLKRGSALPEVAKSYVIDKGNR